MSKRYTIAIQILEVDAEGKVVDVNDFTSSDKATTDLGELNCTVTRLAMYLDHDFNENFDESTISDR